MQNQQQVEQIYIHTTSVDALNDQLKLETNLESFRIKLEEFNVDNFVNKIELDLLYPYCKVLDLTIKGKIGQHEFDTFFSSFTKFNVLESVSIRFYDKSVRYIDSLFIGLRNVSSSVTLNLKNFKKIELKSDFTDLVCQASILYLNLENAQIKDNSIEKFSNYIKSFKKPHNKLIVNMDKRCSFKIPQSINQNSQIQVAFKQATITKQSIDDLVQIVKLKKLKCDINREYLCIVAQFYLHSKGILDHCSITKDDIITVDKKQNIVKCNLKYFIDEDYKLLKAFPELIKYLREQSTEKIKSIQINTHNLPLCFQFLVGGLNQHYDQMKFCLPTYHYYNHLHDHYLQSNKIIKYNKYSWEIEVTEDKDTGYIKMFNSIVNLKLKFNNHIHKSLIHFLFRFLVQQQYLIYLKAPLFIKDYKLDKLTIISQEKGVTFLRFLAFKKTISHLIPLPNQIFYDLLTNH